MEYKQEGIDLSNYEELLKQRRAEFDKKNAGKKVDHSYQELGIEMQKYFKTNIWYLFWRYKEEDVKDAFEICQKKDIRKVGYLIGCIRRKYKGFK